MRSFSKDSFYIHIIYTEHFLKSSNNGILFYNIFFVGKMKDTEIAFYKDICKLPEDKLLRRDNKKGKKTCIVLFWH